MYYTVIKHERHLRARGKCRKHEPQASVFYICQVFSNGWSVLSQCNTQLMLLHLLYDVDFKVLANEDTLLRTQMFPHLPACATFVADTNSGTQKMFLILFRNILCLQQMFPSLRTQRNVMSNNVSATMCPRLPVPLRAQNNKTRFFSLLYSGKTWVFDQSECIQGPIYIIISESLSADRGALFS